MSAIETATKSSDNSPKISRKRLEQTSGTGNYLALSRTLASVLTVSLGDQTILLQLASTINFRVTRIVSRNSVDYSVYGPVSYPRNVLYYPCYGRLGARAALGTNQMGYIIVIARLPGIYGSKPTRVRTITYLLE